MRIDYMKGKKCNGDRIILITTKEKEGVTLFKLGLLLNQLGINEHNIVKQNNYKTFLFKKFIQEQLDDIEKEIDWALPENQRHIKKTCEKYHLKLEGINKKLLKQTQQTKIEREKNGG